MLRTAFLIFLAVLSLLNWAALLPFPSYAKTRKIESSDLARTWIGLTSDELFMFRILLREDSTGIIAYSYLDQEPCIQKIASWHYEKGELSLTPQRLAADCAIGKQFSAEARGGHLYLRVEDRGWRRVAILRSEMEFINRWKRLVEGTDVD